VVITDWEHAWRTRTHSGMACVACDPAMGPAPRPAEPPPPASLHAGFGRCRLRPLTRAQSRDARATGGVHVSPQSNSHQSDAHPNGLPAHGKWHFFQYVRPPCPGGRCIDRTKRSCGHARYIRRRFLSTGAASALARSPPPATRQPLRDRLSGYEIPGSTALSARRGAVSALA